MSVSYLVPHIEISPTDKHLSFPAPLSVCLLSIEEQELTNNAMTVRQTLTNIAQSAHYSLLTMNGGVIMTGDFCPDEKKLLV